MLATVLCRVLWHIITCYNKTFETIADAMEKEFDCFCVRDFQGPKVCEPDNCDADRATLFRSQ